MNKQIKKLNFALIGVGYWGPNYARILSELEIVELTWCCDTNEVVLKKMQRIYPTIRITQKFNDILNDPKVDCVIIVTPAQTHYEIVKQALKAGKHVLVEKPLTTTVEDAREIVQIAKRKKLVLAVDHTFKFNAGIQKLKEIIDEGELGKIYYMYGLYNALGPIRKDVSAMWDLSPHFIYTANYLLDSKPISVLAKGRDLLIKGMDDVVFLNFEYENGVLFNLHSSWLDPLKVRQLVIIGSKKMAVFDDVSQDRKLQIYDKSAVVGTDPNFARLNVILRVGDMIVPKLDQKEPLKEVVTDFIESIIEDREPLCSGKEGMETVAILVAAQKSLKTKKEVSCY
ncbi:MAG: Gfo/Idh/MocA family oxidoreductase [Candidatus Daviesbacteria bacterium]|nr:Gfo/Idh/MocA family oxidoreductase [Candidatus Daviesbacteria bacterium]